MSKGNVNIKTFGIKGKKNGNIRNSSVSADIDIMHMGYATLKKGDNTNMGGNTNKDNSDLNTGTVKNGYDSCDHNSEAKPAKPAVESKKGETSLLKLAEQLLGRAEVLYDDPRLVNDDPHVPVSIAKRSLESCVNKIKIAIGYFKQ